MQEFLAEETPRKEPTAQGSRVEIDSFLGSARRLRDFVAAAFAEEGRAFDETNLSEELRCLLLNVRLVARIGAPRMPQHLKAVPQNVGTCRFSPDELLPMVQHALGMLPKVKGQMDCLNSPASMEILKSAPWQALHELLGDCHFFKLFGHEIYLHVPPGSRWLQLVGRPGSGVSSVSSVSSVPVPKMWKPASIFVERRIFYSCRFAARAGLPVRSVLRRLPADQPGAERLVAWMLSSDLFTTGFATAPALDRAAAPLPSRRERRRRGPRGSRSPCCSTAEAAKAAKARLPAASRHFTRQVFDALLEPVLALLERTSTVKFQAILSTCCPAKHAMMVLKIFEASNPLRKRPPPPPGVPCEPKRKPNRLTGLKCLCSWDGLSQGEGYTCTGGKAEIYFMKNFPAVSCALHPRAVAEFLISSFLELLGGRKSAEDLLGSRNWKPFCHVLRSFVYLRRGEELSLHTVLQGLSVQSFQEAAMLRRQRRPGQLADKGAMAEVLGRVCYFLLAHVAVPLLREHFYATEAEPQGTRTVFFRKHIWHFLRTRADCGFLHLCMRDPQRPRPKSPTPPPLADQLFLRRRLQ